MPAPQPFGIPPSGLRVHRTQVSSGPAVRRSGDTVARRGQRPNLPDRPFPIGRVSCSALRHSADRSPPRWPVRPRLAPFRPPLQAAPSGRPLVAKSIAIADEAADWLPALVRQDNGPAGIRRLGEQRPLDLD